MDICSVIIDSDLIVFRTDICLMPAMFAFFFFQPEKMAAMQSDASGRLLTPPFDAGSRSGGASFPKRVPRGFPEECPDQSSIPVALQDKVILWWHNLPCPECSPGQGLLMMGQPAMGWKTCQVNDDQTSAPKHYGHLNYWHELKVPKIHQKGSLNI